MLGRFLDLAAALCAATAFFACGTADPGTAPFIPAADGGSEPDQPIPNVDPCDTPNEGCACRGEGEHVECGQVERRSGDYVSCTIGIRTCIEGEWSDCIGDQIATMHLPASGQRLQGL